MRSLKLYFKNDKGDQLAAKLELPLNGKAEHYALFAHCFTCSKDLIAVKNITDALTSQNIAVLRFDFTGLGESEGDFEDTNFSSNIHDLICAADFLKEKYKAPELLIGHSLGGAAVILAAEQLSYVKAVATIAAPSNPHHVEHLLSEKLEEIKEEGEATVTIAGRSFNIKKQFLDDLQENNVKRVLKNKSFALLILHSPQDKIVDIENAAEIYKQAKHSKSFISLDGADHLLSKKDDSIYAGQVISGWAGRYMEKIREQTLVSEKQTIARTYIDSFTTDIKSGKHHFLSDEPESVGGNDAGPSPYDLLTAALASCTSMTLKMYAERKKWPLKEIRIHTSHHKVHAEDCRDCEQKGDKIDEIERVIELEGDLSEDQKKRLLEIANKCPVHKTLSSDIKIESSLKD